MTWIIRHTLFHQNVEIENSPNFNDVKVSRYTVREERSGVLFMYTPVVFKGLVYQQINTVACIIL